MLDVKGATLLLAPPGEKGLYLGSSVRAAKCDFQWYQSWYNPVWNLCSLGQRYWAWTNDFPLHIWLELCTGSSLGYNEVCCIKNISLVILCLTLAESLLYLQVNQQGNARNRVGNI